jgi:hypothetical protein
LFQNENVHNYLVSECLFYFTINWFLGGEMLLIELNYSPNPSTTFHCKGNSDKQGEPSLNQGKTDVTRECQGLEVSSMVIVNTGKIPHSLGLSKVKNIHY